MKRQIMLGILLCLGVDQLVGMEPEKKRKAPPIEEEAPPIKKPKVEEPLITAMLADDQTMHLTQEQFNRLKAISVTVATTMKDAPELPLQQISRKDFFLILNYSPVIEKLQNLRESPTDLGKPYYERFRIKQEYEQAFNQFVANLQNHSDIDLYHLILTSYYLNIELLCKASIKKFAWRAFSSEHLNQLVNQEQFKQYYQLYKQLDLLPELSRALVREIKHHYPDLWYKFIMLHIKRRSKSFPKKILNQQDEVAAVVFSPDSRFIATGFPYSTKIWDIQTGQLLYHLEGPEEEDFILTPLWSPNSRFIATGTVNGFTIIWDADTGGLVYQEEEEENGEPVYSISWSPDSRFLAVGSEDGIIKIVDVQTRSLVHNFELKKDPGPALTVSWSLDGKYLAAGYGELIVVVWDMQTGHPVRTFPLSPGTYVIENISWSPNSRFLAIRHGDLVIVWDIQTNQIATQRPAKGFAWSPDAKFLATRFGKRAAILDIQTWQPIKHHAERASINDIAWSPESFLAMGSENGTVALWKAQTKKVLQFKEHQAPISSVSWSSDSYYLATGSEDKTAIIWEIISPQFMQAVYNLSLKQAQLVAALMAGIIPSNIPLSPHLKEVYDSLPEAIKSLIVIPEG